MSTAITGPSNKLKQLERASTALKMYRDGYNIGDIAKATQYKSTTGAWAAVRKALELEIRPGVEDFRRIESARLDWVTQKLVADIKDDTKSRARPRQIEVLLKVMERRAALMGLDLAESTDKKSDGPKVVVYYRDDRQEERREQVKEILDGDFIEITGSTPALPAPRSPDQGDGIQDPSHSDGGRDGVR